MSEEPDTMKKLIAVLFALSFVLCSCSFQVSNTQTPVVIVVTATSKPPQARAASTNTSTFTPLPSPTAVPSSTPTETPSPTPTQTPIPTDTPTSTPTDTPLPTKTDTPVPTEEPVTFDEFNALLRNNGYSRISFTGIGKYTNLRPGKEGYEYISTNVWAPIIAYTDGFVRLEVVNDPKHRADDMETKFKLMDTLFPKDFMTALRKANDEYISKLPNTPGISGDLYKSWPAPANDFWRSIEAQYNYSGQTIGAYSVGFSLWYWQITCPAGYICWIPSFPSEVFRGQNALTFYNIEFTLAP